jgi:hypothetical protein
VAWTLVNCANGAVDAEEYHSEPADPVEARGQVGFHAAYDGQTHQVTSIGNALARLIKPTKAICTSSQAY